MGEKVFTPQEVNKRLPLVKKIVSEILDKGKKLRLIIEQNKGEDLPADGLALSGGIEELMKELEDLGGYYKDWNFEIGLVDFPAMIDGKEVFLCWRSDEKSVHWYHSIEEGYGGRTPIPEKLLV